MNQRLNPATHVETDEELHERAQREHRETERERARDDAARTPRMEDWFEQQQGYHGDRKP